MFSDLSKIVILSLLLCAISVHSLRQRRSTVLSHSPQESIGDDELYNYVIEKFTVPVDHFNSSINKTFEMRYLVNDTWQRGENPPIFFYTGNEGDITGFVDPAGFIYDIAPKFGALIVFAEHRYYGESLPFGDESLSNEENRRYLSSQQALRDYVNLIKFLKSESSMKYSPVIAFGGSYGGMLSAWIRMKYPFSVQGAIASSAPVLQFHGVSDCHGYFRTVTSVFRAADPRCPEVIRKSWSAIDNVTSTDRGRKWLSEDWNLCKVIENETDVENLKGWLDDGYTDLATGNYPYASLSYPANPVNEFCDIIKNAGDSDTEILRSLRKGLSMLQNWSQNPDCIDPEERDPILMTWYYQMCSEITLNLCSDGIQDMFEPFPWNFREFTRECEEAFNVKPQIDSVCKFYGCSDFSSASNIVFSNGLLDPWHTGGVLKNVSETVIAVIIPEGAHQFDLAGSNPEDPESVIEARKIHEKSIAEWIQEYREWTSDTHIQVIGRNREKLN